MNTYIMALGVMLMLTAMVRSYRGDTTDGNTRYFDVGLIIMVIGLK
jgi:hypothetical protein